MNYFKKCLINQKVLKCWPAEYNKNCWAAVIENEDDYISDDDI